MSFICFDHHINKISLESEFQHQRSFLYGDGHFTTMKVVDGLIQFFSSHLARLQQANEQLAFNDINWKLLELELRKLAVQMELGFIKVHFSRGQSLRGYGQCAKINTNIFVSSDELSSPFIKEIQQPKPIALTQLSTQLGLQPLLAGIKHCNRLEQVLASVELEKTIFTDGLVADINGNLIETTKANVIWYQEGNWYTPLLSNAGVSGVILNQLLEYNNIITIEKNINDVIQQAEAVFICNSLIGIQAVSSIDDRMFNTELSSQFMQKIIL